MNLILQTLQRVNIQTHVSFAFMIEFWGEICIIFIPWISGRIKSGVTYFMNIHNVLLLTVNNVKISAYFLKYCLFNEKSVIK